MRIHTLAIARALNAAPSTLLPPNAPRIKPYPNQYAAVTNGAFSFTNWASSPANDPNDSMFAIFIVPAGVLIVLWNARVAMTRK